MSKSASKAIAIAVVATTMALLSMANVGNVAMSSMEVNAASVNENININTDWRFGLNETDVRECREGGKYFSKLSESKRTDVKTVTIFSSYGDRIGYIDGFTFKSSDEKVAKVRKTAGVAYVDILNPGACKITATDKYNRSHEVIIIAQVEELSLYVNSPRNYEVSVFDKNKLWSWGNEIVRQHVDKETNVKFGDYTIPHKYYTMQTSTVENDGEVRYVTHIGTNTINTFGESLFYGMIREYDWLCTEINLNRTIHKNSYADTSTDINSSGNKINSYGLISKDNVIYNRFIDDLRIYDYKEGRNIYLKNVNVKNIGLIVEKAYNNAKGQKVLKIKAIGYNYDDNRWVTDNLVYGKTYLYTKLHGSLKYSKLKRSTKTPFYNDGTNGNLSVFVLCNGGYSVELTKNKQYEIVSCVRTGEGINKGFGKNGVKITIQGLNGFSDKKTFYVDGYSKYVPYANVAINNGKFTKDKKITVYASKTKSFNVKFDKSVVAEQGKYINDKKLKVYFTGSGVAKYKKVSEDSRYITYKVTFDADKMKNYTSRTVTISLNNNGGKELSSVVMNVKK